MKKTFKVVFRKRADQKTVRVSERWEQNSAFATTKDLYNQASAYAKANGWELIAIEEVAA